MAVNSQNDSAYTLSWNKDKASSKKEMYENVNNSVMVPVGVSRMKKTSVVMVEPEAKVNNEYYCDHFLRRGFLPVIQATCDRYNWTEIYLTQPKIR